MVGEDYKFVIPTGLLKMPPTLTREMICTSLILILKVMVLKENVMCHCWRRTIQTEKYLGCTEVYGDSKFLPSYQG